MSENTWIKCSERLPDRNENIFLYGPNDGRNKPSRMTETIGVSAHAVPFKNLFYWQPRYIPSPPGQEEDSPLIKRIKIERDRLQAHRANLDKGLLVHQNRDLLLESAVDTCDDIIEIVKEFEESQK